MEHSQVGKHARSSPLVLQLLRQGERLLVMRLRQVHLTEGILQIAESVVYVTLQRPIVRLERYFHGRGEVREGRFHAPRIEIQVAQSNERLALVVLISHVAS